MRCGSIRGADPKAIIDGGALLTFGGHKGAALSLMVEILCAALGGGKFSAEVDLDRSPGAVTPHTGQTFILIDPNAGRGSLIPFTRRVETLLDYVREAGQERLPGDRRYATRALSLRDGITIDRESLELLNQLEQLEQ